MKKLIIAAAIVCAAAISQAAAISWSASAVLDPVATSAAGKNVAGAGWLGYCVLSSDLATITEDLAKGKTSSLSSAVDSSAASSKGAYTKTGGNVAAGNKDFYLVVLNSTTVADATSFYVSDKVSATVDASLDTTVAFGSQAANTKVAGNWTAMAPEPTSGLLLLIGMGALALRRRRA